MPTRRGDYDSLEISQDPSAAWITQRARFGAPGEAKGSGRLLIASARDVAITVHLYGSVLNLIRSQTVMRLKSYFLLGDVDDDDDDDGRWNRVCVSFHHHVVCFSWWVPFCFTSSSKLWDSVPSPPAKSDCVWVHEVYDELRFRGGREGDQNRQPWMAYICAWDDSSSARGRKFRYGAALDC